MSDDFISDLLPSPSTIKTTNVEAIDGPDKTNAADFKRIFSIEEKRLERSQASSTDETGQISSYRSGSDMRDQHLNLEDERQALGSGWVGSGNQVPDLAVHRGALSVGRVIFTPRQVAVTPQSLAKFMARQGLVSEQMGAADAETSFRTANLTQGAMATGDLKNEELGLTQLKSNSSDVLERGAVPQDPQLGAMGAQNPPASIQSLDEMKKSLPNLAAARMNPEQASGPEISVNAVSTSASLKSNTASPSSASQLGRSLADALRFTDPRQSGGPVGGGIALTDSQRGSSEILLGSPSAELRDSDIRSGVQTAVMKSEEPLVRNAGVAPQLMRQQSLASGEAPADLEPLESLDSGDVLKSDDFLVPKGRLDYEMASKSKAQESNPALSIQKFLGGVKETLDLVHSPEHQTSQPNDQPSQGVRYYQDAVSTLASQSAGQQKIEFRGTLTEAQRLVDSGSYNNLTDSYESWTSKFGEVLANRIMGQVRQDNWSVQLRMSPASLGDISMELDFTDGGLEGRLGANEDATRQLLQDTLPRLRLALRDVLDNGQLLKLDVGDFKHSQQQSDSNQPSVARQVEELDFEAEVLQGRTLEPALGAVVGLNILV